jgi:hypothetical protein
LCRTHRYCSGLKCSGRKTFPILFKAYFAALPLAWCEILEFLAGRTSSINSVQYFWWKCPDHPLSESHNESATFRNPVLIDQNWIPPFPPFRPQD